MKKLAIAAAVAATFTGAAHAYTIGQFSNGFVVPNVYTDGNQYTAVGVISRYPASVYWTFFDQDSKHVTDGCFTVTANDFEPFIWNEKMGGQGTSGVRGYLVFSVGVQYGTFNNEDADISQGCKEGNPLPRRQGVAYVSGTTSYGTSVQNILSASAFQVLPPSDVAYTPVIDGPLNLQFSGNQNLTTMDSLSLVSVGGAASAVGSQLFMRYYVDGTKDSGDNTRIVVWSTGNQAGTHTVNIFDDKQNRKSVNFVLKHSELDWFDPEDPTNLVGRPADYKDGFILWDLGKDPIRSEYDSTQAATTGSVFSYSVISAPAFGAVQTILNPAL